MFFVALVTIAVQLWKKSHVTEEGSMDIYWLVHSGFAPLPPFIHLLKGRSHIQTYLHGQDGL